MREPCATSIAELADQAVALMEAKDITPHRLIVAYPSLTVSGNLAPRFAYHETASFLPLTGIRLAERRWAGIGHLRFFSLRHVHAM